MNQPSNALAISRPLLVFLQWLNALYALAIGGLLVFTLVNPDFMHRALKMGDEPGRDILEFGLRSIVVIGLLGAGVVHLLLRHLRAIVETVRVGDPFVAENARRLQAIAWLVLIGEVMRLTIGAIVYWVAHAPQPMKIDVNIDFSFAPWMAVLLLFVLAGVFKEGARMRADLEGTV